MNTQGPERSSASPLRIAILAHALRTAGGLTVGRNLIDSIVRVAPDNDYCFIVPDNVGYEQLCARAPSSQVHVSRSMNVLSRLRYDRMQVPRLIHAYGPDVVLALDTSLGMLKPPCPQAIFLHASHLLYPSTFFGPRTLGNKIRHLYLKRHFRQELARTQLIFSQTQVIADRLRSVYAFGGKVTVCGTSTSSSLLESSPDSPEPEAFAPYRDRFKLIYVTRYYPHKNIEGIIDVFQRYRDELAGAVVFLTIAPDQHPNVNKLLRRITKLELEDHIVNLGPIPHEHVAAFYQHSDGLIMPTFLEAFSTTYVEAMGMSLPILTSDLDFARESCGDAAMYFDPWSSESIKLTILTLKANPHLRSDLQEKGNARVRTTLRTWDEIATGIIHDLRCISIVRHADGLPRSGQGQR